MSRLIKLASSGEGWSEAAQVRWALSYLDSALDRAGVDMRVVVVAAGSNAGRDALAASNLPEPVGPESFALARPMGPDGPIVVVAAEPHGAMYGMLELADIASLAVDPVGRLCALAPSSQHPATPVRGIMRTLVSDVEDLPWYRDKAFWTEYLTELAVNRVNRFQLCIGIQYNYPYNPVTENYFCFVYPFLLDVPGYDVRVANVSDAERDSNLEMLRFASDEAKRRGIRFQLGLWNHAYDQKREDGSDPDYPIVGLTPQSHAPYCRDALALLLRACPSIDGLTLRVHYEAGIPDPVREDFWRTVLAGTTGLGRPIEIDMHAKGIDEPMIDVARGTGQPVVLSAKYLGEHWGLPYHQLSIREKEHAQPGTGNDPWSITGNERRFTRYGYGDFLREGSDFDVIFRIWPGGQRLLLWGDPVFAAGYGRLGTIAGALGVELSEPLSFKGRKGNSTPDGRDPYADPPLRLDGQDWRKYRYTYRLWGRLLYDPDAEPDGWQRLLVAEFGAAAASVERALGAASRIIPLFTMVHGIGASIGAYWPEMYVDMPIVDGPHIEHYAGDSVAPPTFAGASAFDPSLFYRVIEYADDLVAGRRDGRYTPLDAAQWLESLAAEAEHGLAAATGQAADPTDPAFRRLAVDVTAQAYLGRFFAGKFRAALSHALYERTKDPAHLRHAVTTLRAARDAYAVVAAVTGVYRPDLAFGTRLAEHGHWADRLPAIDHDLAALERLADLASDTRPETTLPLVPRGERPDVEHVVPPAFKPGEDVDISIGLAGFNGTVVLCYRHLNQRECYARVEMKPDGPQRYRATIPGTYTGSMFALIYYFTLTDASGDAWLVPGLDSTLANQPYHVLRQAIG